MPAGSGVQDSLLEAQHPGRGSQHHGVVGGHHHGGGPNGSDQALDDLRPGPPVQPRGRLIGQHQLGRVHQRPQDSRSLPLTGRAVVQRVITNLGVFDVATASFTVVELAPGVTREQVEASTDAPLT